MATGKKAASSAGRILSNPGSSNETTSRPPRHAS